jgi:hypothetical protein
MYMETHEDILKAGSLHIEDGGLEGSRDASSGDLICSQTDDVFTFKDDPATRRCQKACDHVEKCGFPSTIWADDA